MPGHSMPEELVEQAVSLAREWRETARRTGTAAEARDTRRLAALVADRQGLDLAVRFIDRVIRPEDDAVAARELARLRGRGTGFLPPLDRVMFAVGAGLAPVVPRVVVPLARRRLRNLVGHLLVDTAEPALGRHLARARAAGFRPNLNLLGEAVLGEVEASDRTARTIELLHRADVDHVSVKVSSLVSQLDPWDVAGSTQRVLARLRPVYEAARARRPHAFVNLDMEAYDDLDLTLAVLEEVLADDELADLEVGVVLQAYLPDAAAALERVIAAAQRRSSAGGAGVKVRLVKGANLAMERVEAELRGWHQAPHPTKAATDAGYVALLESALRPELAGTLRIGVASHNLYHLALAHLLARERGVAAMMDVEMLQGMAPAESRVLQRETGRQVVLYTPVVAPDDFDVAVSYLVRRLEEMADEHNYLHEMARGGEAARDDQEQRFRGSVHDPAPTERRRRSERPPAGTRFANTTDSDPALPEVRRWARDQLASAAPRPTSPVLRTRSEVDDAVARGRAAAVAWGARAAAQRAVVLRRGADELEARRGELLAAMAAEGGKTPAEADPEVSEAIDFARYYADRVGELAPGASRHTDGARFSPVGLSLVTPPWNFPVAIPAGGVLAALAAGSGVIVKPAPPVPRCTEIIVAALHAAGVPAPLLQVVRCDEDATGRHLVAHPGVDAVLLTGGTDTAGRFLAWRAERGHGPRVIAETSGKNALVITPAADVDLAVADLVRSAFGHAGQKCSAASLAVLVGSVARSARFRRQLRDAVTSLRVGWPAQPGTTMGPVIEAPSGKLDRALTTLEPGEEWLVAPRRLDETGRLWSPGVRTGVRPGSFFHTTECFGPVLGLMAARDLEQAVAWQNATGFGLTAGLHSLDDAEVEYWTEHVVAGNLYINRHITGAIVQRQSFGGWQASSVGPGAKAGGPNYVAQLGEWHPRGLPRHRARPGPEVRRLLADLLPLLTADDAAGTTGSEHGATRATLALLRQWLVAAAGSDAATWRDELGRAHDPSGLAAEANVLRYRPLPLLRLRAEDGTPTAQILRVLLAAAAVATPVRVSLSPEVSRRLRARAGDGPGARAALRRLGAVVDRVETTAQLAQRATRGQGPTRIRLLGDAHHRRRASAVLVADGHDVLDVPVVATGRRELLTVLREQAISRTRHRFGHLPPAQQLEDG